MADQGADARSDRDLPILAGTARHPGRHLCLIPAYRILGRMGRRLGLYLPEFRDRRGARRPLRPSRRSAAGERYILRREPRRDRPDPAFLLPAGETGHGRLAAMGDRSRLPGRHRRLASRGGIAVHWRRHRWRSVLRGFVPSSSAGRTANNRSPGIGAAYTGRIRLDPRQAPTFLPQSRLAHLRQWPRDRALPRAGARARIRLARSTAVPGRCCNRDDQPWPRGDHRDLRWLPGCRLLGIARLNDRNLFPVLHPRAGGCPASGASQRQPQCPRLRKGRLWRRDRNDPGRLRAARTVIGDWLTALIAVASLAVLFRWKVNNPLLMAVTAVVGLIAFPLLQPTWVMVK